MRGQAAGLYWIFFMAMIFAILLLVTYLSPMFEIVSSLAMNLSSDLPLNGSVNTTATRWMFSWNMVPLILIVGLALLMFVVALVRAREYDPEGIGV